MASGHPVAGHRRDDDGGCGPGAMGADDGERGELVERCARARYESLARVRESRGGAGEERGGAMGAAEMDRGAFAGLLEGRRRVAERLGVRTKRVASADVLRAIATAMPLDADELRAVDGVSGDLAREHGEWILRVVRVALTTP